jgi:hypothetical protein
MSIEEVVTCPFGSKCREIKDNKLHRCAFLTTLKGKNPQTGEDQDEDGCAIYWLPILLVENSRAAHSTAAAVETFRNEVSKNQQITTLIALNQSKQDKGLLECI